MNVETYSASAPGNLMLFGEHAVLRNRYAIVCAVNRRIKVTITPRRDQRLTIDSTIGAYSGHLNELEISKPFQFVLGALINSRHNLPSGFDLKIESDFADDIGFGSSAAVTAATIAAIAAWRKTKRVDRYALFHTCRNIIREVQGVGSGSDLAASIFGGVVAYRPEPFYVEQICRGFPISVFYSGKKTLTVDVIHQVHELEERYPDLVRDLLAKIGDITEQAVSAFKRDDFQSVGVLMGMNQGLMDALGLCNRQLGEIVYTLRDHPDVVGAKISGAGLGDCVIAIGTREAELDNYERISVEISSEGVRIE